MESPIVLPGWSSDAARAAHPGEQTGLRRLGDQHAVVVALVCALVATLSLVLSIWIGQSNAGGLAAGVSSCVLVLSGALLAALVSAAGSWLTARRAVPATPAPAVAVTAAGAPDKDSLTGLLNRRAFMAFADDAIAYFQRYHRGFAMLMVAVDDLNAAGRGLGSAVDDLVLGHVADVLDLSLRRTDKLGRFDGDRFTILLREISQADAMMLSNRMRKSVESLGVRYGEDSIPVTVSIGVTIASLSDTATAMLMNRAELALGHARLAGGNTVFWQPAVDAAVPDAARPESPQLFLGTQTG